MTSPLFGLKGDKFIKKQTYFMSYIRRLSLTTLSGRL